MRKALFLDRDGVINHDFHHVYKITDIKFVDGIFDVCKYFIDKDYIIIIITNQAGIARGKYNENDLQVLMKWIINEFKHKGIIISKYYYCPHHPEFNIDCNCRKPKNGMIEKAIREFNIDRSQSIFIGDKITDIEAASKSKINLKIQIEPNDLSLIQNHIINGEDSF